MSDYIEIVLRPIAAFVILMIAARILGKQTIAQMTYFDFIAAITIGAMTANLSFNTSLKSHHLLISFIVFTSVIFLTAYISLKSRRARKFLAGDPTVIIQNGKILEHNMRKMRYSLDYLNQELREQNVFEIEEVLFAVVEINGTLTVLKKPQYRPVTRKDLWIAINPEWRLPIELIMDGETVTKNLQENQLTEEWLRNELNKRNLQTDDVVYAVLGSNGQLYFDTYTDHIQTPVDKE